MSTLQEVLDWLVGGGGALIAVSWAISWGLEPYIWWQKLESRTRSLIILGASLLLGLGGAALSRSPALVEALEPYAQVVILVVVSWLSTQVAHRTNSARAKRVLILGAPGLVSENPGGAAEEDNDPYANLDLPDFGD